MQVTRSFSFRLPVYLLLGLLAACQTPAPVTDNPYQRPAPVTGAASQSAVAPAPVRELHNQALAAINEDQYQLAVDYLQRAIRIAPRNGWSWYYLADVHWRQGELERCLSMLDRADAYALGDARLNDASRELRGRCR